MYITEEQELVRETARDFAERVIKPVAQKYDEEEYGCKQHADG